MSAFTMALLQPLFPNTLMIHAQHFGVKFPQRASEFYQGKEKAKTYYVDNLHC